MKRPDPKKSSSAQSDRNVLLDALKEVEQDRQTQRRQQLRARKLNKWFGWMRKLPGGLRGVLGLGLVALVVLVGDGIRRENQELSAQIAAVRGQVLVMKGRREGGTSAQIGAILAEKDVVVTGSDGEATILFPDGSSILVEPNSRFEVRLLGFSRGEVRDRSFVVQFGSAVARFSQRFGKSSRGAVSTPTAVAAVRGTAFRVVYDPGSASRMPPQTYVAVVEGTVDFRTATGSAQVRRGQVAVTSGMQFLGLRALSPARMQSIDAQVLQLAALEQQPGFLVNLEKTINNALNPLLQLMGLSPGGWGWDALDGARQAATQQALRRIATHIESVSGTDTPPYINPLTLKELQLDPNERDNLLNTFSGGMLESYERTARGQYRVRARARDRAHTLYELTPGAVRKISE